MAQKLKRTLVIGGARSGKSRYAESLGDDFDGIKFYIATAEEGDAEMAARIEAHRARRGGEWTTIEETLNLPGTLQQCASGDNFALVDCLTIWLSNLMLEDRDCAGATEKLLLAMEKCTGRIVIVTNEVGQGIVPGNELARHFRDAAGLANQRLAEACDEVVLVTAGIPTVIKPAG